ncbi:hypothetical protein Salat_1883800 [Sesamum alatum]|uniref:Uncharacterized protein n=1 Tax=Sesamum alatum TaxID=300844 RepID=A0AAE1Y470_9LAMI|nr:hypothetical protein Salat_1883800 [Sesamum alatum]
MCITTVFNNLLANKALKYYYYGFRTSRYQFVEVDYPSEPVPSFFLDSHAVLGDALEPDEEVPQEIPEALTQADQKEDVLEGPSDPMVEDVLPLRSVAPGEAAADLVEK